VKLGAKSLKHRAELAPHSQPVSLLHGGKIIHRIICQKKGLVYNHSLSSSIFHTRLISYSCNFGDFGRIPSTFPEYLKISGMLQVDPDTFGIKTCTVKLNVASKTK